MNKTRIKNNKKKKKNEINYMINIIEKKLIC